MRVLMVGSKEYPVGSNKGEDPITSGGIERYVQELVDALKRFPSLKVTVLTRKFGSQPSREEVKGVSVIRKPWLKGFFLRNPSFNFFSFIDAQAIDFDVIHAHGAIASFYSVVTANARKKPVVATPHGLSTGQPQYNPFINSLFRRIETYAYSRSHVVFLSKAELASFKNKLGFVPSRHSIIQTGINVKQYRDKAAGLKLRQELGLEKKKVVLFAGRLNKVKGVRFLIKAMHLVEDPKAVLLIVGDGPEKEELKREARGLHNVKFLGHRTDVAALLNMSDVFVLPSLSEGMPVVLLEAIAAEVPCVVTKIGLPVNPKQALIVHAGDHRALAKAINRALGSSKLRQQLTRNARELLKEFSPDKMGKKHATLYRELSRAQP